VEEMCLQCRHYWFGGRKGIWPVKTDWLGAGVIICLEQGADLHVVQLMPLPLTVSWFSMIHTGFTFLVPAHPASTGHKAVERVLLLTGRNGSCNRISIHRYIYFQRKGTFLTRFILF